MENSLYEFLDPTRSAKAYFKCEPYLLFDMENLKCSLSEDAPEKCREAYNEWLKCKEAAYEYYKETGIRIHC